MITHVLPCGLSILDNLRGDHRVDGLAAWASREAIHHHPSDAWVAEFRVDVDGWLGRLLATANALDLSAEAASLAKEPSLPGWDRSDVDPVVLLASDTSKGVLAALVNAVSLQRPVRFHRSPPRDPRAPGEEIIGGGGQPVHVVRIPGLVPVQTDTFVEAMIELGAALRWASPPTQGAAVIHVSGGYKAAIPYVVTLAEYQKGLNPDTRVFCLHEGDRRGSHPQPVEIFLRTPDLRNDRDELAAAEKCALDRDADPPRTHHLEGYAYTRLGTTCRLTALGMVLSGYFRFSPS